ncbi:MAG TPA: autotransporter-associated beta strand repeat-containing protein [Tepidisphaeraceae bacterium]
MSRKKSCLGRKALVLAVAAGASAASSAIAASSTWTTSTGGPWSLSSNWTSGVPNGANDIAYFTTTTATNAAVSVDGNYILGGIVFDSLLTTVSSTSGTLALTNSPIISVNPSGQNGIHKLQTSLRFEDTVTANVNAGTLSLGLIFSGAGDLVKNGPGKLIITTSLTAGSWTGGITLNNGTLAAASGTKSLGGNPGGLLTINPGATFDLSDIALSSAAATPSVPRNITVSGNGFGSGGAFYVKSISTGITAGAILNGSVTLAADTLANTPLGYVRFGPTSLTPGGSLGGAGRLIVTGGSALFDGGAIINVPATHAGTVVDAGRLVIDSTGSLVNAGNTYVSPFSAIQLNRAVGVDPASNSVRPNSIQLDRGALILSGSFDVSSAFTPNSRASQILIGGTFSGPLNLSNLLGGSDASGARLGAISDSLSNVTRSFTGNISLDAPRALKLGNPLSGSTLAITSNLTSGNIASLHMGGGFVRLDGANTYSGPTTIDSGTLAISNAFALGAVGGASATTVNAGAALQYLNGINVSEKVILNGGTLAIGGGAGTSTHSGEIVLSPLGGKVSSLSNNYIATIAGAISGVGTLTATNGQAGTVVLTAASTYTGGTVVDGASNLVLRDGGTILSTSAITLGPTGTLALDNGGAQNIDDDMTAAHPGRINSPLVMRGGRFNLTGPTQFSVFEAVPSTTIDYGSSYITATRTTGNFTEIHLGNISRAHGGTVTLSGVGGELTGWGNYIHLGNPTVTNGIVTDSNGVPFVIISTGNGVSYDFAMHDHEGAKVYNNYKTDINTAVPTDNVKLASSASLASSRTINSLVLGTGVNVNLNSTTLTISSGGLIGGAQSGTTGKQITGNSDSKLTAGNASTGGELLVHTNPSSTLTVYAAISNNASAPVAVTKFGTGTLKYRGLNTYTGETTVNEGALLIDEQSYPPNPTFNVNGGTLSVQRAFGTTVMTLKASTINLNGGTIPSGLISLDADRYNVQTGTLANNISGTGVMEKTGPGKFSLTSTNLNYSGPINIRDGVLSTSGGLTSGATTIFGGQLLVSTKRTVTLAGNITLAGGELATEFLDAISANLSVSADSSITSATPSSGVGRTLGLTGALTIQSGATLNKNGPGVLSIDSPQSHQPGSKIAVHDGMLQLNSPISGNTAITIDPAASALFNTSQKLDGLTVNGIARLSAHRDAPRKVLRTKSLSLGADAMLDLADNDIVIEYTGTSPFSAIQALVDMGYSTDPVAGKKGIVSSAAQLKGGQTYLLLFDNASIGSTDWPWGSGQSLPTSAIVGAYTFMGDSDLNGMVTPDDYAAIDCNLGGTFPLEKSWFHGDFDRNGVVTPDDYIALDANLGASFTSSTGPSAMAAQGVAAVPEPAATALAAAGLLLARRPRRGRA